MNKDTINELIKVHEYAIKSYKENISRYERLIEESKIKILELQGKTEICPNCDGDGRVISVHRFRPPHKYMTCYLCNGKGRVTKEVYANRI